MKITLFIVQSILLVSLLCVLTNIGCQDPNEYRPPGDTLIEPPGPPSLLTPPDDTCYVLIPNPGFKDVYFSWTEVEGAQYYQLEYSTDINFSESEILVSSGPVLVNRFTYPIHFYWHVRAGSDWWTWYSTWSDVRYVRIMPPVD